MRVAKHTTVGIKLHETCKCIRSLTISFFPLVQVKKAAKSEKRGRSKKLGVKSEKAGYLLRFSRQGKVGKATKSENMYPYLKLAIMG